MSADALTPASWPTVHRQFEAALPQIDRTIRFHLRHWPRRGREEAIADARAAAWHAWHGLLARGKEPLAVGPSGIAFNACRYVLGGRRLGTGLCSRSAIDVYHHHASRRLGLKLISLEREAREGRGRERDVCREWLAADNRYTPADAAAFRIDFAAWLDTLAPRRRRMAVLLMEGHETSLVAKFLAVTPGAVSQARKWLAESWKAFQAQGADWC